RHNDGAVGGDFVALAVAAGEGGVGLELGGIDAHPGGRWEIADLEHNIAGGRQVGGRGRPTREQGHLVFQVDGERGAVVDRYAGREERPLRGESRRGRDGEV